MSAFRLYLPAVITFLGALMAVVGIAIVGLIALGVIAAIPVHVKELKTRRHYRG